MKKTRKKTQAQTVLLYLLLGQSLTSAQAWRLMRITRLAAVVNVLRDRGHNIKTNLVTVRTEYGPAQIARYTLSA